MLTYDRIWRDPTGLLTTGNVMAIKRKSGKRRSNQSGLISGILIGLLVVGGLGGLGFAGYQIYKKVIVPALAEQRAKKLRDEFAAAEGRPAVPKGWTTYNYGNFQMFVPEENDLSRQNPMPNTPGVVLTGLWVGRANHIEVTIMTISLTGLHPELNGRNFFDSLDPSGMASQRNGKLISHRQLEGVPRCLEASIELDQN